MRLIDADKLIEDWETIHSDSFEFNLAIQGAINDLKKAPAVDAVPIEIVGKLIRCKDCKYYQQGSRNSDDWLWCMMNHHYTDEEKYCAWAERKEE